MNPSFVANAVGLMLAISFLIFVARMLGLLPMEHGQVAERRQSMPHRAEAAVLAVPPVVTACVESTDYQPRAFAVRQLDEGRATLIARYRPRKKGVTALLIIWSGAKRRRMQDSYYDLGMLPGTEVADVVDEFEGMAVAKLAELKAACNRKRAKASAEDVGASQSEVLTDQVELEATPSAVEEIAAPPVLPVDQTVRPLRFPAVYRGVIAEIGMLPQARSGDNFEVFGVRLNTEKGVVEEVLGARLKEELRNAGAQVGDQVEILKLGRKTVEKGKAPMNLYKVIKLA